MSNNSRSVTQGIEDTSGKARLNERHAPKPRKYPVKRRQLMKWFDGLKKLLNLVKKWPWSKTLLLIWFITVFCLWSVSSYTAEKLVEIPPTVVATLSLMLGGEGTRDLILNKMSVIRSSFNESSLSRGLFFFGSLVVLILWFVKSKSGTDLADIPASVVTVLGLLTGGESTRTYLYWRTVRNK